ncbi:bifunctional aspartate kinase/homoserine dehydrogenase II [Echinimonas agarilytica]|uniref:Bifunctional aspartokinase/homoserine dehydrogenase n=1 Tax=Echinimonas agarilytica TaxID=1215918 RepID=A0AA42B629_9GAMM|nr:bifunctional aspartate kinase/homoserine dehydrogenase II [Echinimonas agarilytica]MCM2678323.1 bifunctional aspartate kinase/homoserine dehydrogenase II [Echinimonas agarilytica]
MTARQVHKFGGSSLADSHCFKKVCELVQSHTHGGDMVVVSAAGKTTNHLLACMQSSNADEHSECLDVLHQFQSTLITEVLDAVPAQPLLQALALDIANLRRWLGEPMSTTRQAEFVVHGEMWSARLLAAALNQAGSKAQWLDARVIFCAGEGPQPAIDVEQSTVLLKPIQKQHPDSRLIVTGFIARNAQGDSVTLGRNGSDYSASMLAVLARAKSVTIWTDVAGVFSADPRKVNGAHTVPLLSLQEADELARLGSPVLHARTLQPLLRTQIRAAVRSTFAADGNHTQMISGQAGDKGAKTVTYLDNVSVISIELSRHHQVAEMGLLLSSFLGKHQLMPLATQVSEDLHRIRFCFTEELASAAFELLKDYQHGGHITLDDQHSLIALVGAGVRDNARHYHSFFRRLDQAPVEFTETGPDGVSLVAVLRQTNLSELVAQLHQSIASPDKRLGVALFGAGNIGQAWLELFRSEQAHLANHHNLAVQLCGVVGEQKGLIDFAGLPEQSYQAYSERAEAYESETLIQLLASHPYDELVVIDASDSARLGEQYPQLFAAGSHIVSANKSPAAAPLSVYREITQHQQERARHWFYGATISACMPITESIDALQHAGDDVESVEGVLSGTWSWLLAQYNGKNSFTELLKQAWKNGLAEPDPRDDLSGLDVARKLLILGRSLDIEMELGSIECESLLPQSWESMPLEACWEDAKALDDLMQQRFAQAAALNEGLCFKAQLNRKGQARVYLASEPLGQPLQALAPAVTGVAISTRWYRQSPLILQGPGAGPELAAGAIQMDLFRLCRLIRQV